MVGYQGGGTAFRLNWHAPLRGLRRAQDTTPLLTHESVLAVQRSHAEKPKDMKHKENKS